MKPKKKKLLIKHTFHIFYVFQKNGIYIIAPGTVVPVKATQYLLVLKVKEKMLKIMMNRNLTSFYCLTMILTLMKFVLLGKLLALALFQVQK